MAEVLLITAREHDLLALVGGLEGGGHRVAIAPAEEAMRVTAWPDVVIVDAVKDLAQGRDVCKAVRQRASNEVLLAMVATESLDAIGSDWQIDSFFVEGAHPMEILTRIRMAQGPTSTDSSVTVRVGELTIDPETYQVRIKGRPLDLTYKEFQLLFYLAQRPGRVYSRQQLLSEVWGYDFFGGTRTVDVHVRRLRAKLGAEHENMIATIRNVGYKMESHRTRL